MSQGLSIRLRQTTPMPLDLSLQCQPGEVHALVGPSGSGKSTVLRSIAGTYHPDFGQVQVNGTAWLDTDAGRALACHERRVGMVFQNYALFPHLSAAANIATALGHYPRHARAARIRELLGLMHLEGLGERRPSALSGGEQQRVAVARALARDPDVLLLDEPFSAVDRPTRQFLYREIAALRERLSMPVVLVTHDLDEALLLADRLTVLRTGRGLQTGSPQQVTTQPSSRAVAELLGIRNIFSGRVLRHDATARYTLLESHGRIWHARLQADHAPGTAVHWVIPDGYLIMHRHPGGSSHAAENLLQGRITRVLTLGAVAQVHFDSLGDGPSLEFSVATHVARRHGFRANTEAELELLVEGIHVLAGQP